MNTAVQNILIILAALLAGLLVRLIISLLVNYARVYTTKGTRTLKGFLIKNRQGDLVFYNGLLPLLRRRKGVVLNQSDIQLSQQNDEYNHAEMPAGFFDQSASNVADEFGTYVADIEDAGNRACRAMVGDVELAFSKGSIRSKGALSPYGAAVGALLKTKYFNAKNTPDMRVGIGDLFLPSAIIMMILYYPLMLALANVGQLFFPMIMAAAYLAILLIMFIIKHYITMGNGSFKWTALIDNNAGMLFINLAIVIMGIALCSIIPIFAPDQVRLVPGISILVFAVIANMAVFSRFRHIEDPYQGWSGPWRKPSFKPNKNRPSDLEERRFSWVDILNVKGIKGDDKNDTVSIQLPRSDYEGDTPRVRTQNLFFDPTLLDENDRERFTKRVLNGADKALKDAGETDVYEDKTLTQIVNSAYQICKRYNLADFEMFDLILLFCQMNIEYKLDKDCASINNIMEYYRFASETLYDGTGDCDCKAVLGYKLFELLGVKPEFVMVKTGGSATHNHAAIVLHNDPDAIIQLPPQYKEFAPGKGVYCEAINLGGFNGAIRVAADKETANGDSYAYLSAGFGMKASAAAPAGAIEAQAKFNDKDGKGDYIIAKTAEDLLDALCDYGRD